MSGVCDEREARIRALFPLVRKIAHRIGRLVPGSDGNDLVGDGCIGSIRAVDTFDPARGPSLEHYASPIIAGAMFNGLRRLDPVSERVRRELRGAERERYALAESEGSLPSQADMERRRPALRRAVMHAYQYTPLSLDEPLPHGEHLSADWCADPARIASNRSDRALIQAAMVMLSPRQRSVVALHYFGGKSLRQVGKTLHISAQRASQLHRAAILNLRKELHGAY